MLQDAILGTAVVNPSSKRGKAVAANEQLELYNLNYSEDIAQFANSTHNLAATCRKVALNRETTRIYRKMFEASSKVSTKHTQKNSKVDIFSLAYKILKQGQAKQRPRNDSTLLTDIQQGSIELLRQYVEEQNVANRAYVIGIPSVVDNTIFEGANTNDRIYSTDRSLVEDTIINETDEVYIGYRGQHKLAEGVQNLDITGGD